MGWVNFYWLGLGLEYIHYIFLGTTFLEIRVTRVKKKIALGWVELDKTPSGWVLTQLIPMRFFLYNIAQRITLHYATSVSVANCKHISFLVFMFAKCYRCYIKQDNPLCNNMNNEDSIAATVCSLQKTNNSNQRFF